jgi:hypothetical protein
VTATSPVPERRRSRPGSLERPVNARLYRATWLLVALPLLLLAFSVGRPPALRSPHLPAAFDKAQAASMATDLATSYPDRRPGTPGARGAAAWFRRQLEPYGFHVHTDPFTATIAGRRTTLVNLVTEKRGIGLSPPEIIVMAHRDDSGAGNGVNDNASGTAALPPSGSRFRTRSSSSRPTERLPVRRPRNTSRRSNRGTRGSSAS